MANDTTDALKSALTLLEYEARQRQERPNSPRARLIALSSDEIDAVVDLIRERLGAAPTEGEDRG